MFASKDYIILNTNNSIQSLFLAVVPISFVYSFILSFNSFLVISLYQAVVSFPSEKSLHHRNIEKLLLSL